jgi:CMP-N-acetylneuraminic acid synthetase
MSERVLAVIPARGGSKRVPRKNIREVGGKPLLTYAIEQAADATAVNHSIVSTEDDEIKSVAQKYGGNVPFNRPDHLATDTATSDKVAIHAIEWFEERGETFDTVCLVPVPTPFRTPEDITNSLQQLHKADADSVVSVSECDPPPVWAVENNGEYLKPYFDEEYLWGKTQTQEAPTLHYPNGAVFAARVPVFLETETFYTERTISYEMPRSRSLDIDEPYDLELARALMEYQS